MFEFYFYLIRFNWIAGDITTHDARTTEFRRIVALHSHAALFPSFFIYNQKNNNKFLFWFIGSPGILNSPPPSPSCSHPNANGDVFFPRGNSSNNGSASSSSSVQPSTPSSIRMHDDYRSAQWSPRSSVSVPRRRWINESFFPSLIRVFFLLVAFFKGIFPFWKCFLRNSYFIRRFFVWLRLFSSSKSPFQLFLSFQKFKLLWNKFPFQKINQISSNIFTQLNISSEKSIFHAFFSVSFFRRFKNRYRLTSASDEDDYDEDVHPLYDDYEEHMQYMAARERLQEFPGRIPPRKKRDMINAQPRKSRVSIFVVLL